MLATTTETPPSVQSLEALIFKLSLCLTKHYASATCGALRAFCLKGASQLCPVLAVGFISQFSGNQGPNSKWSEGGIKDGVLHHIPTLPPQHLSKVAP